MGKKAIFLISSIIWCANLYAQFPNFHDISYFRDNERKYVDVLHSALQVEDGFLVAHVQQNKGFGVLKMNFQGQTVWTTNYETPNYYHPASFTIKLMRDGFIYGLSRGASAAYDPNPNRFSIWKIDPANGAVLWVSDFESDKNYSVKYEEIDSAQLAFCYYNKDTATLAVLEKRTGTQTTSISLGSNPSFDEIHLASTSTGKVYFGSRYSLWCFDSGDFSKEQWKKDLGGEFKVAGLFVDRADSLYMLGDYDRYHNIYLKSISKSNAGEHYSTRISADSRPGAFIDTDSVFYFVMNGNLNFHYLKFDKLKGTLYWNDAESMFPAGSKAIGQKALCASLDNRGDLLIGGYYFNTGINTSVCAFMKISDANGRRVNRKTQSKYIGEKDAAGKAIHIGTHNSSLVLLAQQDVTENVYKSFYMKFNPTSWEQEFEQQVRSSYIATSQTKEIVREKDQMIVFSQKGPKVQLEGYDLLGNLEWSREYAQSYYTQAGVLLVHEGYAYIACTNYKEHALIQYKRDPSVPDPPAFLQISKIDLRNGGLVATDTFQNNPWNSRSLNPVQFLADGSTIYLLFEESGFLSVRSIVNGQFKEEVRFDSWSFVGDMRDPVNYSGKFNLLFKYEDHLFCFGGAALFKIKKNLSNYIHVNYYDDDREGTRIYDLKLEGDRMYACGTTPKGRACILGYDLAEEKFLFQKYFSEADTFFKMQSYNDSIVVSAQSGGKPGFYCFSYPDFNYQWSQFNGEIPGVTHINDFEVFPGKEAVVWAAQRLNPDYTFDGLIGFSRLNGGEVHQSWFADSLLGRSRIGVFERSNDSTIWFGGAHNYDQVNEGILGRITFDTSFRSIQDTSTSSVQGLQLHTGLYPNPCKDEVRLYLNNTDVVDIRLISLNGTDIPLHFSHAGSNVWHLKFSAQSGIYFLKVQTGSEVVVHKLQVIPH